MHPPEHGKFCPPPPGCRSMAPRKKDKGRQAARKQKRAGKDVLRELYKLCPEAGGEAGVKEDGKEMFIRSAKVFSLPESIGTLDGLQILNLSECPQLLELPDTIGGLKALTSLDLSGCESLTALPNAIGELGALTELHLNECSSLTALPVAIGELGALTELWLTGCSSLVALPDAIGKLSALTLNVDEGSNLTMPPNAVHAMPGLTVGDSNSGLSKASPQATDADEAADEAVRDQPEEEHEAETERKILEFWEIEGSLSDAQRPLLRRLRRRVCDACGRQGTLEVERFPVCYCGAKRYCDESCQLVDWDRGHSTTCASGHTFPQEMLDKLREIRRIKNHERIRDTIFKQYPPPADRVR